MVKGREAFTPANVPDEMFDEYEAPTRRLTLPKGYLSISQVSMYLRCPRQYKFRYVDQQKRPPAAPLAIGSSGHAALELTHHHLVDHKVPAPTDDLLDCFSDKWTELSALVEDWEGETPGHIKDQGLALVRLYNTTVAPRVRPQVDAQQVRGIEKKFELTVAGVPMLGFIDLIDTNAAIAFSPEEQQLLAAAGRTIPEDLSTAVVDFKFKAKSMAQGEADGSIQLTLYSAATGIYVVRFDQLLKQKIPKIKPITSTRTRQDHLWLQQIVRDVADAISKGVFPPCAPDAWSCSPKWCGFFFDCRGKKH